MNCKEFTEKLGELSIKWKIFSQSIEKSNFVSAKEIQAQIEIDLSESLYKLPDPNKVALRRLLARKLHKAGIKRIDSFHDGRARAIEKSGRTRIIDMFGNFKTKSYYAIFDYRESRARVDNGDDKDFFIDLEGNVTSERYDKAEDFSEGLALVKQSLGEGISPTSFTISVIETFKVSFINEAGKNVFGMEYNDALSFSDGLAAVNDHGRWYFIDRQGKRLTQESYREAKSFRNGFALIRKAYDGWYYINQNGKEIAGPFKQAENFHDGLARVKKNKKWIYINSEGKVAITNNLINRFEVASDFSESFAVVRSTRNVGGRRFGPSSYMYFDRFINKKGRNLNNNEYLKAYPFKNGYAVVAKQKAPGLGPESFLWTYVDKTGKEISSGLFNIANDFSEEGLALVKKDNKVFFIDISGKQAFLGQYDAAHGFYGGIARVSKNGREYYIDKKGRPVFED